MRVTGTVLKVEDYSGDFTGDDGRPVAYVGQRLHVLDGIEVVKVKIPRDLIGRTGVGAGQVVDIQVTVAANAGARGAYLTTTFVGVNESTEDGKHKA